MEISFLCPFRQPGDLGAPRGVAGGVAEAARTGGFPSPSFGGFGFFAIIEYPYYNYGVKVLKETLNFS